MGRPKGVEGDQGLGREVAHDGQPGREQAGPCGLPACRLVGDALDQARAQSKEGSLQPAGHT